jgi:hypothetical protein
VSMNVYLQGTIVVSNVTFRDTESGNAVDPETVEFYSEPFDSEPTDTITYTSATVPAVGTIARLGVGRYRTWVDTSEISGVVLEAWNASGNYQAVGRKSFQVNVEN